MAPLESRRPAARPCPTDLQWLATAQAQTAQTIAYGETATGEVADRLGDEWVFTGCLNDQVTVTMQSDALGAYLELYGPTGRDSLTGASVEGPGVAARIVNFTLPASGEYTIIAAGLSIQDRVAYTLTLDAPNVPVAVLNQVVGVLTDGTTVTGTITSRLADEWAVRGCPQDIIALEMNSPDFTPYIGVTAPGRRARSPKSSASVSRPQSRS